MENIASQLPAKNTSLNAAAKRQSGGVSLDKSLFDAFINVDGLVPGGKERRGHDGLAEKVTSAENGKGLTVTAKVVVDAPVKAKHEAHEQADTTNDNHDDDAPAVWVQGEAQQPEEMKRQHIDSVGIPVSELRKMLGDQAVRELQKLLGLDTDAPLDDDMVIAIPFTVLAPYLAQDVNENEDNAIYRMLGLDGDAPMPVRDILLSAINAMLNQARKDLAAAEEKVRDVLTDIAAVGTQNIDEVVDATVERNLQALDAWKAAVAKAVGGDAAIAAGVAAEGDDAQAHAQKAHGAAQNDDGRPTDGRAQNLATGGRADASLTHSQSSAVQTLPLLPTQLTGGQQRLPVANQNIDIIARPAGVLGDVGGSYATSAAARALGRNVPSLPQVYEQVTIRLHRMAKAGEKSMTVQLNPAELGRVDVKLDFAADGRVSARITADNQPTLDLLRQDSRALERALTDAGLKMGGEGLQFSLRNGGDGSAAQQFADYKDSFWQQGGVDTPLASEEVIINVSANVVADGRVDIRI